MSKQQPAAAAWLAGCDTRKPKQRRKLHAPLSPQLLTHLLAQAHSLLLSHTLGNAHGGHAARLCAADLAALAEARLLEVLRHLRGLAAARLANHHQHLQQPAAQSARDAAHTHAHTTSTHRGSAQGQE